jgi:hypothetical protein
MTVALNGSNPPIPAQLVPASGKSGDGSQESQLIQIIDKLLEVVQLLVQELDSKQSNSSGAQDSASALLPPSVPSNGSNLPSVPTNGSNSTDGPVKAPHAHRHHAKG